MENLFMQVFESRDWVTAQMRQQVDSHAQSLARGFHLHGHRPPPWLLPPCAGGPQELNGKPIIPEFLFAGSQITTPATSRTVFLPAAVPSTSLRSVGVPNGYTGLETICDTLDANQHEVPQQKQVSVDQEMAEASSEVNVFSVVKRSRSRQRHIEDRSREKDQGAKTASSDVMQDRIQKSENATVGSKIVHRSKQRRIEDRSHEKDHQGTKSGSHDVMQDRIQRSEHATVGSNRTTASLSSKPCGDGANNAGTTTSLLDQENGFHASEDRSTESFKRSKDSDLGNQGVQLDCSRNQIASSDNNVNVPNDSPVRNLLELQVTGSVCHALPETYLSVEPKKLQFDGVESVCMDPASEQIVQQPECALKSANFDLAEAHSSNEVQVTGSVCHALPETYLSVEPKKLQFDGVKSACTNPASEQTMQQPECSLKSANSDLADAEAHSLNEVQFRGSVCSALPETYFSVEPKKLQFDGVESVCMNPVSEQTMQQLECALESDNFDIAEAHSLNEDPPSTSCLQVPRFMGRLLLDGVEPGYLNPDSVPMKQLQESVLACSSPRTHSVKEDQSPTTSSKVPNPTSIPLVERDTLHTLEDTERSIKLDSFLDRIITQSPESSEPHCSDSHVSHPLHSEFLEPPTQLADPSSEAPASSQISLGGLVEEDGCDDLLHSLTNDEDRQSSQFRSAACSEKLQPQTSTLIDAYNTSVSPYKTQSNGTHSNGSPVVNASVSQENESSQEQHFLARTSVELNEVDVDTPLGHASPGTQKETLNVKPAYDAVNCHSGKVGDDQAKFSALTKACDISVSNKKVESAAPEVKSSISARRISEMHTTERNSMTSAENLRQDGTEDTSLLENAIEENTNFCTADKWKSLSQPCGQKRSVQDEVQVNGGLSSKRRRMRCRSDFDLSRTPCADSLSLNHQVGIAGDMLTTTNFSEKSQPSGHYFLRSSGSCKSMSLDSELGNAASNYKISVASDSYGNRNSSRGRRNTTSLLNVVLDNSPSASTSRSTVEGRVFDNSQEQMQNILTTTYNEENCAQQEDTCLPGLNVTSANVAEQGMALQMDSMSSPITISNPENYSGSELFPVLPSYAFGQHGEQASAPNALFHQNLCHGSNIKLGRKYKSYDPKGHLLSGAAISRQLDGESFECDDSVPEFESFDVPVEFDSPTIGKRPFEALYDSNAASGGVWETLPGKSRHYSFSDDLQQYRASDSRSIMDSFGCGLELDSFFISDAVASCSSDANSRQVINETPLTPSVEKYSLRKLSSRPGSGSEHMGSIPELECFRIDEENSVPEEDEYQDRLPGSVDVDCSEPASGRKALQDITGLCQNTGNSPSLSTRCMDTGNMDSSAESFSSELNHHLNIRNDHDIIKPKGSHPTSVKREGSRPTSVKREGSHPTSVNREGKVSRSLHGRFGTAEKLNSRNGRHRSEANVDRQSKPSNIVANMTSFIPLVKQKSQPTCVKKDVKVKALKAAEAAKRLEEKKQKEQEIRKAAAKVERERLKREKELKQKLEEEQKKKRDEEEKKKRDEEEQKKKREVDVATKKRQREEGEKKETMKKRKCIDEARKQQKQPMDRRRGTKDEKDARHKASDNMEPKKNSFDVGKNQVKLEGTTEPALRYKGNTSKDEKGVAADVRPASFGSDAKESIPNCHEESYRMTPFKDSDDEDEDDLEDEQESRRRMKFVPSWARKENLDKILLSNITLDPREIFAGKLSFDISDVFSAYIPKRGLR